MNKPLSVKTKGARSWQRKPAIKLNDNKNVKSYSLIHNGKTIRHFEATSLWFPIYRAKDHDPL